MKKIFIVIFIEMLFVFNEFSQTFRNAFDNYEGGGAGGFGQGLSYHSDVAGELNSGKSIYLQSYLTMFKATKDKRYLDKFIIHTKRVQKRRNDFVKKDSVKSKSLGLLFSPLLLLNLKDNIGNGFMGDFQFFWAKKNISLSTGLTFIQWHYKSPLFDSLTYYTHDPAEGPEPQCKRCRVSSNNQAFLILMEFYYRFLNIKKLSFFLCGGFKIGIKKNHFAIIDKDDNYIASGYLYGKKESWNLALFNNSYIGVDYSATKRINIGISVGYESFLYYLPFAMSIKMMVKYKFI